MPKKMYQKLRRTESRLLGALSRLDEFLVKTQESHELQLQKLGCLMILRRTTGENKPEQAACSKVLSILFLSLGKVGKKNRLDKFLTVQISIATLKHS